MLRYSVCAVSKPGSKHEFLAENNQDACAVRHLADGVAMAVSDGAGSRPHSRSGADLAVLAATDFLAKIDWTSAFRPQAEQFVQELQARLAAKAESMGLGIGDLACTVLALVAAAQGVRALQIGDGFIVVRSGSAAPYRLLFPMAKGEHANETAFVTQRNAMEYLYTAEDAEPPFFVCLSSDGVERQAIKLRESEPHAPFFDYLGRVAASEAGAEYLEKFLSMPSFDEVTDDDRTLVCAVRNGGEEGGNA